MGLLVGTGLLIRTFANYLRDAPVLPSDPLRPADIGRTRRGSDATCTGDRVDQLLRSRAAALATARLA